jgi:hypothetical protein
MTTSLHGLRGGDCTREEFEPKDDREAIAASGGRLKAILDFEFLSRAAPPCKQRANRLSVMEYLSSCWNRMAVIAMTSVGAN